MPVAALDVGSNILDGVGVAGACSASVPNRLVARLRGTTVADSTETPPPVGALSWQPILVAAATAAGGAAWVASVGSTVIAVRLENAHLPAASVVALMSAEHRFAIGASYLIAPLFVGFVGFLAD
ncbi:MAG: hypothetical protein QOI91_633, partial [Solirubrobacteraceae bacterium]|nr:hypothetical protein [Solirubrobacteraceae bacterium]